MATSPPILTAPRDVMRVVAQFAPFEALFFARACRLAWATYSHDAPFWEPAALAHARCAFIASESHAPESHEQNRARRDYGYLYNNVPANIQAILARCPSLENKLARAVATKFPCNDDFSFPMECMKVSRDGVFVVMGGMPDVRVMRRDDGSETLHPLNPLPEWDDERDHPTFSLAINPSGTMYAFYATPLVTGYTMTGGEPLAVVHVSRWETGHPRCFINDEDMLFCSETFVDCRSMRTGALRFRVGFPERLGLCPVAASHVVFVVCKFCWVSREGGLSKHLTVTQRGVLIYDHDGNALRPLSDAVRSIEFSSAEFSRDGALLVGGGRYLDGDGNNDVGAAAVWDVATGDCINVLHFGGDRWRRDMCFVGERTLAVGCSSSNRLAHMDEVRVVSIDTGEVLKCVAVCEPRCIQFALSCAPSVKDEVFFVYDFDFDAGSDLWLVHRVVL